MLSSKIQVEFGLKRQRSWWLDRPFAILQLHLLSKLVEKLISACAHIDSLAEADRSVTRLNDQHHLASQRKG